MLAGAVWFGMAAAPRLVGWLVHERLTAAGRACQKVSVLPVSYRITCHPQHILIHRPNSHPHTPAHICTAMVHGDASVKARLCQREVLTGMMGLSPHMRPEQQARPAGMRQGAGQAGGSRGRPAARDAALWFQRCSHFRPLSLPFPAQPNTNPPPSPGHGMQLRVLRWVRQLSMEQSVLQALEQAGAVAFVVAQLRRKDPALQVQRSVYVGRDGVRCFREGGLAEQAAFDMYCGNTYGRPAGGPRRLCPAGFLNPCPRA